MLKLKDLFLKETDFERRMDAEVEPYLGKCRRERWIKPSAPAKYMTGKGIHLLCYEAENPRAMVVISHGFTETEVKYHEIVYYFLQMQYNVYLPEHCGHGWSYRLTSDPSLVHVDRWERYSADFIKVSRLAKKEHPELPLFLYGHSMGGGIAAVAASLAPELYERVILSSPMIRPLTAKVPWIASALISRFQCVTKKGEAYVTGQKPYAGAEAFEGSSGTSEPRFLRYDALRQKHVEMQTCAASYGWLYESLRMSGYLMTKGYRRIRVPVLILRPQTDVWVSVEAQDRFAEAMNEKGQAVCMLKEFTNVKHEVFNSGDATVQQYWESVFKFFSHING